MTSMTSKLAREITGGLGNPSKMPGASFGLSAYDCAVGSKLRLVPGSTCATCYATKGHYRYASVQTAHARRLAGLTHPRWVEAMAHLISREEFFRWHDSGDLQGIDHLERIIEVARRTPKTRHWLPTREKGLLTRWVRTGNAIPENLTIRLSAALLDQPAPNVGIPTSTVHKDREPIGHACPAPSQGNACGSCRACWDRSVPNVSYHAH